jgi:hypothetical protein
MLTHESRQAIRALPVRQLVKMAADARPHLFVVVDTEEEFDWDAPFDRACTSVAAMQYVGRAQQIFDRYRIAPTYVIDYPVASQPEGFEPLLEIYRAGRCEIGAHLHPWVTPPHEEEVTAFNSFTCNLPPALQRAKLEALGDVIRTNCGVVPRVFKAGRYGVAAETVRILEDLEYEIDFSVSPRMDFRAAGGPDFAGFSAVPFFLSSTLLEVPCTIDYTGWLGVLRPGMHRLASQRLFERLRAPGILNRLGAANRVMLSPEGNTFEEMRKLTLDLVARGHRCFSFSYHSPSLKPGCTPYVRSEADLQGFLRTIDQFCEFFMGDLQGVAVSPRQFRDRLLFSGFPS